MSDTLKFGIQREDAIEFLDKLTTKESVEVAERKNRRGVIKKVYPHNPTTEISMSGGGTPPLALGAVTDAGIDGIAGGVLICKEREATDNGSDFNEFSVSAKHYPNAELGTTGDA